MTAVVANGFDFSQYLEAGRLKVEAALDSSLGPERPESLRKPCATRCWRAASASAHPVPGQL